MNTPLTKTRNHIPPSNQTATLSQFRLSIEVWAVVLSLWITFGLSTVLNSIAFNRSLNEFGTVELPQTMRDAIWLVIGIWTSGYLAGFVVGVMYQDSRTKSVAMRSAALGFLIGVGFRLFFINIFPATPTDGFGVVRDLFELKPLPVYYTFLLLTLVVGPALTALASFTGLLLAQEVDIIPFYIPRCRIHLPSLLLSSLLPITIMLLMLGAVNIDDADTVKDIQNFTQFSETQLPPVIILYFNTLTDPSINMLIGAFMGILVGLSYAAANRSSATLSAGVGLMIHVMLIVIFEEIFSEFTLTESQSVEFAYIDNLNLVTTQVAFFLLLWIGPILTAAASAFAVYNIREAFSSSDQLPLNYLSGNQHLNTN